MDKLDELFKQQLALIHDEDKINQYKLGWQIAKVKFQLNGIEHQLNRIEDKLIDIKYGING